MLTFFENKFMVTGRLSFSPALACSRPLPSHAIDTHARTHARTYTQRRMHTRTQARALAQANSHTHTHTHSQFLCLSVCLSPPLSPPLSPSLCDMQEELIRISKGTEKDKQKSNTKQEKKRNSPPKTGTYMHRYYTILCIVLGWNLLQSVHDGLRVTRLCPFLLLF